MLKASIVASFSRVRGRQSALALSLTAITLASSQLAAQSAAESTASAAAESARNVSAAEPVAGASPDLACLAPESALRLDHVTIAAADLDALAETLTTGFGFSTKPGRLHTNGLENRHIKFRDGSALELMTVHEPADDLAQHYADLIEAGGGGAYLALSGPSVDSILAATAQLEPALAATRSTAFDWAAFPDGHTLESIFFIEMHQRPLDRIEHVTHRNGATALTEVWIAVERPDRLVDLLLAFGARDCGVAGHPEHLYGRAVGLSAGTIYVVDAGVWQTDPGSAPVLSVTVGGATGAEPRNLILGDAGGLWVALVPSRP